MGPRHEGDLYVNGHLRSKTASLPDGTVDNAAVSASADIAASKMVHYHAIHYTQQDGTDVAATGGDGYPIHVCRAAGTIIAVEATVADAASGGDKAATADVHLANDDPTAAATVLTGTIALANGATDYAIQTGTISSATLAAGDVLLAVVAVSGSTGTQNQGLNVTVWITEDYS